jgi:hypothetical protein
MLVVMMVSPKARPSGDLHAAARAQAGFYAHLFGLAVAHQQHAVAFEARDQGPRRDEHGVFNGAQVQPDHRRGAGYDFTGPVVGHGLDEQAAGVEVDLGFDHGDFGR